jgi:hypothetical protein
MEYPIFLVPSQLSFLLQSLADIMDGLGKPQPDGEQPMRLDLIAAVVLSATNLFLAAQPRGIAGEPGKDGEKFVDLFDGKSLSGWKVAGCEATVEDGMILLKSGNGWLYTDGTYKDFVLEVEWKPVKWDFYDSGVYIRAELPPQGKPWPARNQINLRKDLMGNIKEIKEAVARPDLVKPGEWNRFRVTVVGTTASLEINGKLAWKIEKLKPASGYIGLQCEVPAGGQFLFRSVRVSTR